MRTGTPGFVPLRLVEAREARGFMSREALAQEIGKSASTVTRWEEGGSTPEPDALRSLATALNVRPEYFIRPSPIEKRPVFFRSLSSTLKREKAYQRARVSWLQEVSRTVQRFVELPEVNIPDVLQGATFKQLRDEDLESIALDLRAHWKLGEGPCTDVVALMERVGFVVASEQMNTSRMDGLCQWSEVEERPYVLLATDKMSFARRQLDAAHEMAHAILHRNVSDLELRDDFKLIEEQAFRLGSAFLLPHTTYPTEAQIHSLTSLEILKERWKVSIKAQIHRLKDLHLIDNEDSRFLYKSYSAKGWTRGEPFDSVWPLQRPRALSESLNAIVDAKVRTKAELLDSDFTLPARDIESLCGLEPEWFGKEQGSIVKLIPRASPDNKGAGHATVLPFKQSDS